MPTGQTRHRHPRSHIRGTSDRANDALTNLSAYALTLDAEYHRLNDRLLELTHTDTPAAELCAVLRQRDEMGAEREAFRYAVGTLREQLPLGPVGGS